MNELSDMIVEQARALHEQFQLGLSVGKKINRVAHLALMAAYEIAQQDKNAKLPTPLSCAIENILRLREEQEANEYANAMIKRDQETPRWEREVRTGGRDKAVGE